MTPEPRDRSLGLAGAVGGLIWAAIPTVAAVAIHGIEGGVIGLDRLAQLGALLPFAGLSVVGMLAGTVGLYRRFSRRGDRPGRIGSAVTGLGFALLLPGSVVPTGRLPAMLGDLVPIGFFAGLVIIGVGSLGVGLAARRERDWPRGLPEGFGLALPIGAAIGGLFAILGAGRVVFVLGLMVPYGVAWIWLGLVLARGRH